MWIILCILNSCNLFCYTWSPQETSKEQPGVQCGEQYPALSSRRLHVHIWIHATGRCSTVSYSLLTSLNSVRICLEEMSKDALNWPKVIIKTFIMMRMIVLNNALCLVNWNVNYHMKSTFKSDCLCLSMHSIALLWPVEWEVISRMFLVDQAISIHQVHDKTQDNGNVQYQICPGELNRQPSARSFSKPESFSKSCENVCCPLRSVSGMQRGLHIPAAEGHDGVRAGHCVCSQNHWQEKGEFLHDRVSSV